MDRFIEYLTDGVVPNSPPEGRRFKWKAFQFTLVNNRLYKKSFLLPLLKCMWLDEADYILQKIHEGICENHLRARTLTRKALRQEYYWPTMREDAMDLVQKYDCYQFFTNLQHLPTTQLSQLSSPWPFVQWGMDILGPFFPATGQWKFSIIAINYFTKWVEAELLAHVTEHNVKSFL